MPSKNVQRIINELEDNDGETSAARIRKLERRVRDLQQEQKMTTATITDNDVWQSLELLKHEILNPSANGSRGDEILWEKFRDVADALKPYRPQKDSK